MPCMVSSMFSCLCHCVLTHKRAMLSLTEPMSNGWGGGCYILARMADGRVIVIDGSSESPSNQSELPKGSRGGKAVAVPGTMYAMNYALEKYGKLSARTLLQPVVERARTTGWIVGMSQVLCTATIFLENTTEKEKKSFTFAAKTREEKNE